MNTAAEILNHASAATPIVLGADGEPPREIQLFPMGTVQARDGRGPWTLADEAHAREVIAATQARHSPTDMMVDYDHQAVFAVGEGKGGTAEAAAWIDVSKLTVRADGIWAAVEWTEAAAAKLKARTYRYLSPYFGSDKASGRLTRFFNVGLVNQPAIREIAAAASVDLHPGTSPSMKTILTALGLKDDATEAEACASIASLISDRKAAQEAVAATATALGLGVNATGEAITAAATAAVTGGAPDPQKFVPIAALTEVTDKLKVINEERASAAVDDAVAAGKLTPALKDWGKALFNQDEAQFTAFVQGQPAVLSGGAGKAAAKVDADKAVLTDEDRQVCAAMGISEADFLKSRESEVAQ
ncbi:hypothetical protein JIP62_06225 [Brevundimonas vitis]|uniref:Mu-like prophage I protein n=1 Tax=Brevundimonas vitisensis TaxID=2800818 RepID=A0ABX7BW00_9CAUL|nr:phage protease [Brevundimonas vitisensis]QQQ19680.1 hypothetical protein JIP62_06225 [Brevundimonas vitisensis]